MYLDCGHFTLENCCLESYRHVFFIFTWELLYVSNVADHSHICLLFCLFSRQIICANVRAMGQDTLENLK